MLPLFSKSLRLARVIRLPKIAVAQLGEADRLLLAIKADGETGFLVLLAFFAVFVIGLAGFLVLGVLLVRLLFGFVIRLGEISGLLGLIFLGCRFGFGLLLGSPSSEAADSLF